MSLSSFVIIGGGFAGISAALMLGRARQPTKVIQRGPLRNAAAHASHGLITHDGAKPEDIWNAAKKEIDDKYSEYVQWIDGEVAKVENLTYDQKIKFLVTLADGSSYQSRRVIIATGVTDTLPNLPGLNKLWGKKAHICPYCDAFEYGAQAPLGVVLTDSKGIRLPNVLSNWSTNLTVFADTATTSLEGLHPSAKVLPYPSEAIWSGKEEDGIIIKVPDDSSASKFREVSLAGLFVQAQHIPRTELASQLGVDLNNGFIAIDSEGLTNVPGVAAVGDVAWPKGGALPMFQVAPAIGLGSRAAVVMCTQMVLEDAQAAASTAGSSASTVRPL
jgi:thioredoxin reductase